MGRGVLGRWVLRSDGWGEGGLGYRRAIHQEARGKTSGRAAKAFVIFHTLWSCHRVLDSLNLAPLCVLRVLCGESFGFSWRSLRLCERHKPFLSPAHCHSLKPPRSLRRACFISAHGYSPSVAVLCVLRVLSGESFCLAGGRGLRNSLFRYGSFPARDLARRRRRLPRSRSRIQSRVCAVLEGLVLPLFSTLVPSVLLPADL